MSLVGIILNRENTPSLSTDASMGMASHPEASKSVGQDAQPEPADAGGAKRASPSQGAAGGENDGDGNGAEGDSPTSPADELPGRDDPMDGSGTGGGGGPNPPDDDDDPSDPGDHESGPDSEYYAPAESADACIVVHYLFRRAGYPPALAAWRNGAWPRRLLYPDKVNLVEDALALPLWQGLSEDQFFQMLDNASATDRRFGEYDWDFLSKAILSDTMNADDIHHAGAKALADWAEENLGPLSIGPRPELVARLQQMQTEKGFPDRESANESGVGSGKQYVPRPPLEDQPNSNQISADVFRGREVRLGLTLPDSQSGDDELSAQDATWNVAYCDFYKAAANLWRARSCLREAAGCMIETGYIHPWMAAAIAATEKVERFCNVLRAANRYAGLGTYRFNDIAGRNLLEGFDGWRTSPKDEDHPEFLAREVEDVFRSYCAGLLRSESFDLKSCVIDPEPAPKAEPAPKMKPPPPSLAAGKGPPRRSAPAVHTGSAHTAKRPRETGGGSTGSVQIPGHYFGKARTKESPVQPSEPPMGGAGGSAQPSEMDVDKGGTKDDEKKDEAAGEAAAASKSAKPHPAKTSRPAALGGSLDVTLISDVRERDRDISDDEFSPTNVCMFPESWEGVMPASVIDKAGGFEQFRNELMRIQRVLDSPALVDLGKVDLDALGEPPKEYVSDEDHESHVDDDGMGPYVDKFSSMGDRDLVPSKQEPPYYEAKAWRTTEEEIERMKNLFPYFRAENYRLMSASTGPIGTKPHVQGVLPTGASLEEALMAKPGVCPITSTYNLTYEGEEVVIDAQSGIVGRIACLAGNGIFHFFPEIRDVSAFIGRSSRESHMLLEILSGNTDPTRLSGKPGEQATFLCGTVPDILGGWMSMTLISTLFEALYGINKCTSVEVATWTGALAKENPSYPPVELLVRTVCRADGTKVGPNEVLFARSTLIGRDVPFKVFKRWALRDRTPIGPLLRPMGAADCSGLEYRLVAGRWWIHHGPN